MPVTVYSKSRAVSASAAAAVCSACNHRTVLLHPDEHLLLVWHNKRFEAFREEDLLLDYLSIMNNRMTIGGMWRSSNHLWQQGNDTNWLPYYLYLELMKSVFATVNLIVRAARATPVPFNVLSRAAGT